MYSALIVAVTVINLLP